MTKSTLTRCDLLNKWERERERERERADSKHFNGFIKRERERDDSKHFNA